MPRITNKDEIWRKLVACNLEQPRFTYTREDVIKTVWIAVLAITIIASINYFF